VAAFAGPGLDKRDDLTFDVALSFSGADRANAGLKPVAVGVRSCFLEAVGDREYQDAADPLHDRFASWIKLRYSAAAGSLRLTNSSRPFRPLQNCANTSHRRKSRE
jgi:hypothetical protein